MRPAWVRLGAIFLLGFACALWLLPLVAGPEVQRLRLQRDDARGRVEALEAEVKKLKETQQQGRARPKVERVKVQVEGAGERVALEAERRLTKQLAGLYVGRDLDDVDAFLLARRVQGLLLEIDGVQYQFQLQLLLVARELAVYGELGRP
ncbi:MAG TPA: hypothetical protein VK464_08930 [Symbiobacteriaceae bacterium]|nr:hypothetical protein [Symbiobacteriaceae bacterium]